MFILPPCYRLHKTRCHKIQICPINIPILLVLINILVHSNIYSNVIDLTFLFSFSFQVFFDNKTISMVARSTQFSVMYSSSICFFLECPFNLKYRSKSFWELHSFYNPSNNQSDEKNIRFICHFFNLILQKESRPFHWRCQLNSVFIRLLSLTKFFPLTEMLFQLIN